MLSTHRLVLHFFMLVFAISAVNLSSANAAETKSLATRRVNLAIRKKLTNVIDKFLESPETNENMGEPTLNRAKKLSLEERALEIAMNIPDDLPIEVAQEEIDHLAETLVTTLSQPLYDNSVISGPYRDRSAMRSTEQQQYEKLINIFYLVEFLSLKSQKRFEENHFNWDKALIDSLKQANITRVITLVLIPTMLIFTATEHQFHDKLNQVVISGAAILLQLGWSTPYLLFKKNDHDAYLSRLFYKRSRALHSKNEQKQKIKITAQNEKHHQRLMTRFTDRVLSLCSNELREQIMPIFADKSFQDVFLKTGETAAVPGVLFCESLLTQKKPTRIDSSVLKSLEPKPELLDAETEAAMDELESNDQAFNRRQQKSRR